MKDENDKHTLELVEPSARDAQGRGLMDRPVKPKKEPKPFLGFKAKDDEESFYSDVPKSAKRDGINSAFVPVSFVAKDWKVTPRRIRSLLADGRLNGRLQDNGYWEVRYPYQFTMGTRGPDLKRHQRPEKHSGLTLVNTERRAE